MTTEPNQIGYRFYVVDINTVSIESGWEYREDAMERAKALKEEGGVPKVCGKQRCAVGNQNLDPNDPASWVPKRNQAPPTGISGRHNPGEPGRLARYRDAAGHVVEAGRHAQQAYHAVRPLQKNPRRLGTRVLGGEYLDDAGSAPRAPRGGSALGLTVEGLEADIRRLEQKGRDEGDMNAYLPRIRIQRARLEKMRPRENPGELLIVNGHEDDLDDNPGTHRAEKIFAMWHQKQGQNVGVIRLKNDVNDEMVCVGKAWIVTYRSGKWEAGNKTNDYYHTFDSHPKVWMLRNKIDEEDIVGNSVTTAGELLKGARGADGRFAVAELARPLDLSTDNGTDEGDDIALHNGGKVYGAVDKKTVIIVDPVWGLIVIKGAQMTFDERGIVK